MPYTLEGKAVMLYAMAQTVSHMSLHDGPPNEGNELVGGVYRRRQCDFGDPADGEIQTDRKIVFDVAEGVRVTHAGFWTNEIGGTLLAWKRLPSAAVFRGRGNVEVDLAVLDLNLDEPE